jgi:prolyl-tRNA synthetase
MNESAEVRRHAIRPTRAENFPEWYQQVIRAADLAELSSVRGCMIIKPNGYAIWERIRDILDGMIKETGHRNAYFPLLIPKSHFEREAIHVEGFAKECAVVTHSQLAKGPDGTLIPISPLEEPLVVRPTSEMVIGEAFARWIQSYRDLPLLINQWANVVRWEMRPRLFLRTAEFLWQEGHTAHESAEEAQAETLCMLELYRQFAEKYLCLPVLCGKKTTSERFPGAEETYAIEAMMQDGKALQAATSHFLGQNFAHACAIKFAGRNGQEAFAWTSSWGSSTRLIGGLIMAHGDDDGIILPPDLAPVQVAVLPLIRGDGDGEVLDYAKKLRKALLVADPALRVEVDGRPLRGGEKFWQRVKGGTPLIVELGRRELEESTVSYLRRDGKEKMAMPFDVFVSSASDLLRDFGKALYERQLALRRSRTVSAKSKEELREFFADGGGFAEAYFCGDRDLEKQIGTELSISTRCIPLDRESEVGPCIADPSQKGPLTIFAKAY